MTKRITTAVAVTLFSVAAPLAIAQPAAADPVKTCQYRSSGTADSGVSRAVATLSYCSTAGGSWWWEVTGTLYDTSADNRTAYVNITRNGGGDQGWSTSGYGTSKSFTAVFYGPGNHFHVMTRACNTTCSSKGTVSLYP